MGTSKSWSSTRYNSHRNSPFVTPVRCFFEEKFTVEPFKMELNCTYKSYCSEFVVIQGERVSHR